MQRKRNTVNPSDLVHQQSQALTIAVMSLLASVAVLGFFWPAKVVYAVLPPVVPVLYVAVHSIVHRISILRLRRWAEGYAEGGEAIFVGIYLLLDCFAVIAIFLLPLFAPEHGY